MISYDPENKLTDTIATFAFWQEARELFFCGSGTPEEIEQAIRQKKADVLLCVLYGGSFSQTDFIRKIMTNYPQIPAIFISGNLEYEEVRHAFLRGAFDYLGFENLETKLYHAIRKIPHKKRDSYFSERIYDKVQVLMKHIFDGGNRVEDIVRDIVDCIYEDWHADSIDCQQVVERVKLESYKSFVRMKPWLEKFIYRGDYIREIGFDIKPREEITRELCRYYSEVNTLFVKYNVIDENKTIYTIGKSVIKQVDQKVTLESVARDVYLNRTYISQIFKEKTGIRFNDFVLDVKIDRAKTLLHYPEMTVGNAADILCFATPGYFSSLFKQHTGRTPQEYQCYIRNCT